MKQSDMDVVLNELHNCINIFLDQLSAEKQLLLTGDANDLNNITLQKQETIQQLTALETRHAVTLKNIANNLKTSEKWQETLDLLNTCHRVNAENGALVNQRLKQANNSLHQLHSLLDSGHSVIYSENGTEKISTDHSRSVRA